MNYPTKLLPQKKYKIINCDISNSLLIRHIDIKDNDYEIEDPETGNVKLKYISQQTKHIADYSTSLFGIFTIKHLAIRLTNEGKKKYNEYCEPNSLITPLIFNDDFLIDNNRKFISFKVGSINNKIITYPQNDTNTNGKCVVEHTPMKWNYWHFSVRWVNENFEYLNKQPEVLFDRPKTGWVRLFSTAARAMLANNAKAYVQECEFPKKKCYQSSDSSLSQILLAIRKIFWGK
ncbi:MAG: hypothetical protein U0V75_00625 [Ferruginibacter sp.]